MASTTTTTTPRRCDNLAPHEAHDFYAPTGRGDEHRETFCYGVPRRLPSCPDYCEGLHYGHTWTGLDDSGVPFRWESIQGEKENRSHSAEVHVFCQERYGEEPGRTLVAVRSETDLTPADDLRLAEQITSAAHVAEEQGA